MSLTEVFLGIDVGTSSTKGVAVDATGTVIRVAQRHHHVDRPSPGHVEMQADSWWDELTSIVRELLGPGDLHVAAVGVDGIGPCVVLADSASRPLRPAILYGIDTRAEREIAELTELYGDAEIRRRGGSGLTSQAVGPKLAWLARHEPETFSRARRLFMASSFLVHRLTGEYVLDHHSASQSSPLYDIHSSEWHTPWWDHTAAQIERPRLAWPADQVGVVTERAASETGLAAGIPVVAGTIDAWSEAVSVDAQNAGDMMLMYGSTMFLIHTVREPLSWPTLWTTAGAFPDTWNLAGGMSAAGATTDWLGSLFGNSDASTLMAEAAQARPGSSGLLMLPYLAGERTPIFDPHARGVLIGLTLSHTRGDLYRAALEAVAFGVRHNIEAFDAAGGDVRRVVAVGGGVTGGIWTQIVSDVTGLEQELRRTSLGASYGSAYLAASSVGTFSIGDWNPVAGIVSPRAENAGLYDDMYSLYLDLYPATVELAHALASQQLESLLPSGVAE
jgi:xylulokinase